MFVILASSPEACCHDLARLCQTEPHQGHAKDGVEHGHQLPRLEKKRMPMLCLSQGYIWTHLCFRRLVSVSDRGDADDGVEEGSSQGPLALGMGLVAVPPVLPEDERKWNSMSPDTKKRSQE